nr:tigger transposable element-derived protein 2-like [Onthophagus taurus]
MFLPPNCTPLIQPMDQNAIRLTKVYYRKSLLEHVLSIEEDDISKALKNISIKDAVFMLANAWDKLSANLIAKCWRNVFGQSDEEKDPDDDIPLSILKIKWMSVQKTEQGEQELKEIGAMLQQINNDHHPSQSEVNDWIVSDKDHVSLDSDGSSLHEDADTNENELKVKHENAIKSFTCIQWAEENAVDLNTVTTLRILRQRAMKFKQDCMRQTKLFDFF